jgi:hypothetical protein
MLIETKKKDGELETLTVILVAIVSDIFWIFG